LKTLSHIKEVTIVSLGSLESLRKELRNAIKEAAAHEDFDPDEEIEKLIRSLKDTGKGKKETEEEMKAFKEFLKNELKEIKEDDHNA
jgi:TRAP-type C4-dicarboxylate transport system substrate-binding protein